MMKLLVFMVCLCLWISGCATTAEDVGKGMQVGAAGSANNPLAPVIWVAGMVVEKAGTPKPRFARTTRELTEEELEEKDRQLESLRKKADLDVKFMSGLTLKTPFRPYVADFCAQHPEINGCAKEYLEVAKEHLALLAEVEAEKNTKAVAK
jgi:hypothetical protein